MRDTIKMARSAPVQEHVATLIDHYAFTDGIVRFDGVENMEQLPIGTKLYTTPPAAQRQWVGLTAGERDALFTEHYQWDAYGKAIEAKLREKNNR